MRRRRLSFHTDVARALTRPDADQQSGPWAVDVGAIPPLTLGPGATVGIDPQHNAVQVANNSAANPLFGLSTQLVAGIPEVGYSLGTATSPDPASTSRTVGLNQMVRISAGPATSATVFLVASAAREGETQLGISLSGHLEAVP